MRNQVFSKNLVSLFREEEYMKTYRITVNGEVYEVTVEEMNGPASGIAPPRVTAPAPAPAPPVSASQTAPKSAPAPAPSSGGKEIQAPMPGKILAVEVVPGDTVKNGAVLVILEAMKMENDIMATGDGTVKSVNVKVGDSVNTGDVLVVIG
jgi:biotin carboxyl carrier protein